MVGGFFKTWVFLLISISLTNFWSVYSACADESLVPGSRYTSARGAAMGESYLPLADDAASALFYNPAGLAKLKSANLEPINLSAYGNSGYLGSLGADSYKVTSLSNYQSHLQNHPGSLDSVGFSVLPTFSFKDFAFGVLYQDHLAAQVNSNGSITYHSVYQVIPTAGIGMKLADGIIRIGYSVQWVNEAVGDNTVPAGTTPLGYNQSLAQGSGFSQTVGFALTLPYTYLPSFNLVARNLFNTNYNSTSLISYSPDSTGAPASEPMTFDSSLSMVSKVGNSSHMSYVLEMHDISNRSGVPLVGRGSAGLEFSYQDALQLRGGWGNGYPSAGFGVRRKNAELDLVWYSEELGDTYHSDRDIRYMLQYRLSIF